MSDTVIKSGAVVNYSIIDSDTVISEGAYIGEDKASAKGITVVGSGLVVGEGTKIEAGAMVNGDYDGVSVANK